MEDRLNGSVIYAGVITKRGRGQSVLGVDLLPVLSGGCVSTLIANLHSCRLALVINLPRVRRVESCSSCVTVTRCSRASVSTSR